LIAGAIISQRHPLSVSSSAKADDSVITVIAIRTAAHQLHRQRLLDTRLRGYDKSVFHAAIKTFFA
jgi:hypothetical protein